MRDVPCGPGPHLVALSGEGYVVRLGCHAVDHQRTALLEGL